MTLSLTRNQERDEVGLAQSLPPGLAQTEEVISLAQDHLPRCPVVNWLGNGPTCRKDRHTG